MRFTKEFIAKALAGDAVASKELAKVLETCAVAGCRKARLVEHAGDVQQELWFFLLENSDRLDENYNIEPYLIETARRKAQGFQRKFGSYGTEGEESRVEGVAGLAGNEVSSSEEATEAMLTEADQQAAMKALLKSSPALRKSINQKADNMHTTNAAAQSSSKSASSKGKALHPDQEALRRLRSSAGLTQAVMATRLGLKLPTYQAYEYGHTKKVPARVMEAARNLAIDPAYSYVMALYHGRPMHEIANEWARRMGIGQDKPAELARALHVNKSNTSRWLNPKANVKLSPEELLTYDRRVAKEEEFYQNSLKRHRAAVG